MTQLLQVLCRFVLRKTLVLLPVFLSILVLQHPAPLLALELHPGSLGVSTPQTMASKSGVLAADETWSGTVLLTGDVVVPEGITLTILPGTEVQFLPGYDGEASGDFPALVELHIAGSLVAKGTAQQPIRFTSGAASPAPGDWGRIMIESASASSHIEHAIVEYATIGITTVTGNLRLNSSQIQRNLQSGLIVGGSGAARIENNIISRNAGSGMEVVYYASPLVLGNVISDNDADGIWLQQSWEIMPVFHDNTITGNGRFALNNETGSDIDATNNEWGTTDTSVLDALINDFNDNAEHGLVAISSPTIQAERHITGVEIWSGEQTISRHIWLDSGAYLLLSLIHI